MNKQEKILTILRDELVHCEFCNKDYTLYDLKDYINPPLPACPDCGRNGWLFFKHIKGKGWSNLAVGRAYIKLHRDE